MFAYHIVYVGYPRGLVGNIPGPDRIAFTGNILGPDRIASTAY